MKTDLNIRVKELCKAQGIQLKDLAAKMKIKPESLSRAISGNPHLSTIQNIADALNVEIVELFATPNCTDELLHTIYKEIQSLRTDIENLKEKLD